MLYLIAFITIIVPSLWSMENIITIQDRTGTAAVVTDKNTYGQLQKLSGVMASTAPTAENVVITPLSKEEITFLLQLNANKKDAHTLFEAFKLQKINLQDITRNQIDKVKLVTPFDKVFNQLVILETADGLYVPLQKDMVAYFFTTLAHFIHDLEDNFIITISRLTQPPILQLFDLVKNVPLKKGSLSLIEWENYRNTIKAKAASLTTAQLLPLLEAANFLEAKSYILTALYELYKANYPQQEAWDKQLTDHPFLEDISFEVATNDEFLSIALLLKKGKKDFYSFEKEHDPATNTESITLKIEGPAIYDLTGILSIPGIHNCKTIIINNTKIAMLKKDTFKGLTNLEELHLVNNKALELLEPASISLFGLKMLKIKDNNIASIAPGVIRAPSLTLLWLANNHMVTLKAGWAKNIFNLSRLIINEPDLALLEDGWLHGLTKLQAIQLGPDMSKTTIAEIKESVKKVYERPPLILLPGEL